MKYTYMHVLDNQMLYVETFGKMEVTFFVAKLFLKLSWQDTVTYHVSAIGSNSF